MLSRRLPRATGLLRNVSRAQACPAVGLLSKRRFTTPTQPLNATEVTVERDAFLSRSARSPPYLNIALMKQH